MGTKEHRKRADQSKIHALTSIRFLAALYVVLFHTRWGISPGSVAEKVIAFGWISVTFFFVLSGYILGRVYLTRSLLVPKRRFFLARFARIYPLYIASILFDVPFALLGRVAKFGLHVALKRVLLLLGVEVFMQQMWTPTQSNINLPSWSLSMEAAFYLSFPFLGPLLWKLRWRTAWIAGLLLYIFAVALHWTITLRHRFTFIGSDLGSYLAIFALGIVAARLETLQAKRRGSSSMSSVAAWGTLLASCAVLLLAVCFYNRVDLGRWHPGLVLAPVFSAVIVTMASSRILPVRLLSARWLVALGEASYGLYLLHVPFMHLVQRLFPQAVPHPHLLTLVIIGISVLSFYFYEVPMRTWILQHRVPPVVPAPETLEEASDA